MPDLFRRDQASTISGPNPDDTSTYAEHIVHARGKRTRYTSVSTSPSAIRDFGEQLWKLTQPKVTDAGHIVISREELLRALRAILETDDDRLRELAARAIPRANLRKEALVDWQFVVDRIERKERMSWAEKQVREFFTRC